MEIPTEIRDLVALSPLAHLVTLNPDGTPQVSGIWIGMDGDEIVSGHMHPHLKVRNLGRDPRFVLSFEAPRQPGELLQQHVILRGTARIERGGAYELLDRLIKGYVAPDRTFPDHGDGTGGYVVRYDVTRIGGQGPWVTPRV